MIDLQRNFGLDEHQKQHYMNESIVDGMRKSKTNESEANNYDDDGRNDGFNINNNNDDNKTTTVVRLDNQYNNTINSKLDILHVQI